MNLARIVAMAIRNPVVTAASFIAVVVLFTTLVVVSYPDSGDDQVLPVVQARSADYKVAPDFDGGMDIAHQDSTVYDALRASQNNDGAGVENLLAAAQPVANNDDGDNVAASALRSKEEMLAAQGADETLSDEDRALLAALSEELSGPADTAPSSAAVTKTKIDLAEITPAPEKIAKVAQKSAPAPTPLVPAVTPKTKPAAPQQVAEISAVYSRTAPPQAIPAPTQKIEISRVDPAMARSGSVQPVQDSRTPRTVNRRTYEPGTSPDTLEFVRSVLDQKDMKAQDTQVASAQPTPQTAARMNAIQPTAGTSGDTLASPRTHYVQLGSVRSEAGAQGEWKKLQATFTNELGTAPHRVTRADLGEKGTFFRIQAGPFTANQASAICASIKTQKPGGCLVIR